MYTGYIQKDNLKNNTCSAKHKTQWCWVSHAPTCHYFLDHCISDKPNRIYRAKPKSHWLQSRLMIWRGCGNIGLLALRPSKASSPNWPGDIQWVLQVLSVSHRVYPFHGWHSHSRKDINPTPSCWWRPTSSINMVVVGLETELEGIEQVHSVLQLGNKAPNPQAPKPKTWTVAPHNTCPPLQPHKKPHNQLLTWFGV